MVQDPECFLQSQFEMDSLCLVELPVFRGDSFPALLLKHILG